MKRVLGAIALVAAIVLLGAALPTLNVFQQRLSAYGAGGEDVTLAMSVARNDLGFDVHNTAVGTQTLRAMDVSTSTIVYVVFGVERGYSASEREALLAFIEAGGHALVLDDFGESGTLLGAFGIGITSGPLLETRPEPTESVRTRALSTNVSLVRPAAYIVSENATAAGVQVIARTENSVVLDVDDNGRVDETDPPDSYPVAVRVARGAGTLVAVADPTFLTNDVVASSPAGLAFLRAYLESVLPESGGRAVLVVDESRHVRGAGEVIGTAVRVPALVLSRPVVLAALLVLHGALTLVALRRYRDEAPAPHAPGLDKPYWPAPGPETLEAARGVRPGGVRP